MTRFKKGLSGNPAGRKKGIGNKVTEITKELMAAAYNEQAHRISAELEKLEGETFLKTMFSLAEFFMPKMSRTEHTDGEGGQLSIKVIASMPPARPQQPAIDQPIQEAEVITIPLTDKKRPF